MGRVAVARARVADGVGRWSMVGAVFALAVLGAGALAGPAAAASSSCRAAAIEVVTPTKTTDVTAADPGTNGCADAGAAVPQSQSVTVGGLTVTVSGVSSSTQMTGARLGFCDDIYYYQYPCRFDGPYAESDVGHVTIALNGQRVFEASGLRGLAYIGGPQCNDGFCYYGPVADGEVGFVNGYGSGYVGVVAEPAIPVPGLGTVYVGYDATAPIATGIGSVPAGVWTADARALYLKGSNGNPSVSVGLAQVCDGSTSTDPATAC